MGGNEAMLRVRSVVLVLALSLRAGVPAWAAGQTAFPTPEAAVTALVAALQAHETATVGAILGPGSEALIRSGDAVKDRAEAGQFLDAYAARHSLVAADADRQVLHVGPDDWPLPIPLVRRDGSWRFDSQAGAQEIVDRRIGRNEVAAIRVCLSYVDAQKSYFDLFRQASGIGVYAQRLVSTEGNFDGLYWPAAEGVPDSPLSPLVATAVAEGYPGQIEAGRRIPYQGYYYRILTAQGRSAPGGARSYFDHGKMTGGFGLVAWPAIYGASGITTFIVDQDGIVFQKDLGSETAAETGAMTTFEPSLDWTRVDVAPSAGSP